MSDVLDPGVWEEVVHATLSAWLHRQFQPCSCDLQTPTARCAKHVEFIWRKRFKDDLVTQFVRAEPWLAKADRQKLRDLMVTALTGQGFPVLLANTSSSKARVNFPDGSSHRVTGVALNIRRRTAEGAVVAASSVRPQLRVAAAAHEASEGQEEGSEHYSAFETGGDGDCTLGESEDDEPMVSKGLISAFADHSTEQDQTRDLVTIMRD